ncbi:MAG: DUF2961 domain-containing protein [Chthonomonadales bacterium]|nr:DUF2961 domain-containing protein [Chthonomonadales bacterium]
MTLFASSLKSLVLARNARTRRKSSYDVTGGNRDCWTVEPGDKAVIAEIEGAGCITHLWFTVSCPDDRYYLRHTVLRAWWDGEENPSIEVPLGDFFNIGHGLAASNAAAPLTTVAPKGEELKLGGGMAMNSYWQMPFARGARLEIANEGPAQIRSLYFYVDYEEYDALAEDVLRFHAQWRRENPTQGIKGDLCAQGINYWSLMNEPNLTGSENYVILQAEGRGHFVGCNLSVDNIDPTPDGLTWWGEGDDMIFIDGEKTPSMIGTGSEDYLCHAWGMHPQGYPYAGTSVYEHDPERPTRKKQTSYRFHIEDPIMFERSLLVTIEHGHANLQSNDYSSTAYWYQTEPHAPFPALPGPIARRPRPDR